MSRGRHAARRGGGWRLVVAGALLVGLAGTAGTWAAWTDSSVVTGAALASGTMDLQFDAGGAGFGDGLGTAYAATAIAATGLAPGESIAFPLVVRNVGVPTFAWTATARQQTPWTYVGTPFTVTLGTGTPSNSGSSYPRTGSCTGGSVGATVALAAGEASLLSVGRSVAGGATDPMCVVVQMSASAANDNQGRTGAVRIDVTATQVLP